MKNILSCGLLALAIWGSARAAQDDASPPGVHRLELEAHRDVPTAQDLIGDAQLRNAPLPRAPRTTGPCYTVFGYLPYWESAENIRWDLLTHVAAFAVEVNANGTLGNDHGWPWTSLVTTAHANGVKVVLVATLFDSSSLYTLVTTPAYKNAFFVNIKNKMLEGTADGINIDFEGSGTWRSYINDFMAELTAYMHAEVPGCEVTFAGPAVNWGGWDLDGLALSCDGVFIMGYAFWGSWSTTSGPNAPLTGGSANITDTVVNQYATVTQTYPNRLILGVPYYGGHWTTTTSTARAPVIAWQGSTRFYEDEPAAQSYGRQWDATSQTPWYRWHDGSNWHQVWYDDAESLGLKYQLALDHNLQGVGMWALNYDRERDELWDAIQTHFVDPCCESDPGPPSVALFNEDFDDEAAGTRWHLFASSADHTADFAYDYSARGIPSAPNALDGSTVGVRFSINNYAGVAAALSAFPIDVAPGDDFALRFDMWLNYNGGAGGGYGSTEFMTAGISPSGDRVNWPGNAASDGHTFAVSGEGGATNDYRAYTGATELDVATGVYAAASQDNTAALYQALFTAPPFETAGAPGKQWVAVEVRRVASTLEWRLNDETIAVVAGVDTAPAHVLLGYLDPYSSIANPTADNFVLYDNVRVVQLPQTDCNANGINDACEPVLPGDYDSDNDVDADDFSWLADCLASPGAPPTPANLTCAPRALAVFDFDGDDDIDLRDVATFQALFTGN